MPTIYNVIRRPLITEKGLGVKETESTLVFDVAPEASKTQVKQAVETLFKVKVAAVRTANVAGKERRRGNNSGFRPDWKKAYGRLKSGAQLGGFLDPWQYGRLNTVERVLLAQLIADEPAKTARHLNDLLRLQPPNLDRTRMLFDTAVKGSALENERQTEFGRPVLSKIPPAGQPKFLP